MTQHLGPPLGPGDDDPRSPAVAVDAVTGPLGPGDDDPRSATVSNWRLATEASAPLGPGGDDPYSPALGDPLPATKPLGPGDSTEPHDGRVMLAPAPAGPGGTDTGPRHLTHLTAPTPIDIVDDTHVHASTELPEALKAGPGARRRPLTKHKE